MPGSWKILLLSLALIGCESGHMSGLVGSIQWTTGVGSAGGGAAFLAARLVAFLAAGAGSVGASIDGGLSGRAFLAPFATGSGAGAGSGEGGSGAGGSGCGCACGSGSGT